MLFFEDMNKKIVLVIAVVLLLLLGGGAYVMMGKSQAPAPQQAMEATPTQSAEKTAEGTLKALIASAIPQTCSFTNKQGADVKGTVYTSGGKMRGDFTTTTSKGVTSNGHMVVDADTTYVWTDEMKQGFKMKITDEQKNQAAANSQAMDLNQNVSYTCKPWIPDAGVFTLPKDISFMEFSLPNKAGVAVPPETGTEAGAAGVTSQCAMCANLPATAQEACKAQLGCK
jgi:hypothetical protein